MKIGILALQGAFIEHHVLLRKLSVDAAEVRLPADLKGLSGLIIPGGESTTILKLMHTFDLFQPLKQMIVAGLAVWGTCAGMICLAKSVSNTQQSVLTPLGVMDIKVKRNAFGRQVDSFEADLDVPQIGEKPYHAVFIRAPLIEKVGDSVHVLAKLKNGTIVAAQQNKLLVTSFHPELTEDTRFHEFFLKMAVG
ncbi:MAG TPA: pyridoxal 5'-phosphate synthase glutaminase subunit PdxT [Dehalococcoidales bacterium]|nr:pyridoxal 5'-phosphate synthase glutaminase subunit PdxT [Dehalococcoidales bacterium]